MQAGRKTIRLKFVDMQGYRPAKDLLIYKMLARHFDMDMCGKPDYIISSGLGAEHLKYNDCVKLVWLGENTVPDFNWFDYAIGFDYLEFGDRYIRAPLFAFCEDFPLVQNRRSNYEEQLLKRDFCSFVVSSPRGNPIREKFFTELSKYKKVASGGRFLNNVGECVVDKMAFIRKYKFNIAFENSSSPGYVTEKIMQAFAAQTVPIYYGDPLVERDFNLESFVRVENESDVERAVEEIIRLDRDDDAYMKVATAQCMAGGSVSAYEKEIESFLVDVFGRPLETARRRPKYGYQADQCGRMKPFLRGYQRMRQLAWFGMGLVKGHLDLGVFRG